jgi:radical SAM protein
MAEPAFHTHPKSHPGALPRLDYDKTPFLIIWETTQACELACVHCRASAQPARDPAELTTEQGKNLLDQAREMGVPIFVLSGGDPLKRPDLCELIQYGASLGLRMATVPAATPLLTETVVKRLKDAGLSQMALSLDYPRAELHDAFRGVPGAFRKTLEAAGWARRFGMPLQINTTVYADSLPYLEEMADLVELLGIVFWEVFFLVPTGRGTGLQGLTPEQCEDSFEILYRVQKKSEFLVKVTEAQHYRRYVMQQEGLIPAQRRINGAPAGQLPPQLVRTEGPGQSIGLAPQGVNSGNGFLFISHRGEIFPSGFLPISAGNVRQQTLQSIYRDSALFQRLRRPDLLHGVCGYCEFNAICGGSRSRAYALTGDILASDPWCLYRPSRPELPTQNA